MFTNHLELLKNNIKNPKQYKLGTLCLHLCDNCQLGCLYCNYKENKEDIFLSKELMEALSKLNPINVVIVGGGEPTYGTSSTTRFQEVLEHLNSKYIGLITNGVEFPIYNWRKKPLSWVRVSLDACNHETYYQLKRKDKFFEVLDNIKAYGKENIRHLGVGFTVNRINLDNIPELPKMLAQKELVKENIFIQFKILRGYRKWLPSKDEIDEISVKLKQNIEKYQLTSFFNKRSNLFNLQNFYLDKTINIPSVPRCYYSLFYLLIRANGDVYPCGLMSLKGKNKLGNLINNRFEDVVENIYRFHDSNRPCDNTDCIGCWDNHINQFYFDKIDKENEEYFFEELLVPYPFSRFWS